MTMAWEVDVRSGVEENREDRVIDGEFGITHSGGFGSGDEDRMDWGE